MKVLYFGCGCGAFDRDGGHFMYAPGGRSLGLPGGGRLRDGTALPWERIDGQLAPVDYYGTTVFRGDAGWKGRAGKEYPNGVAALHHKDGWTALSFWDNTGDSRGNSNSNFFFDEALDFDQAVAAAREHFPELFARFDFDIVPVAETAHA